MPNSSDNSQRLETLLDQHGLDEETVLFRATLPEFLDETADADTCFISANADPSEAVIDEYAGGHTALAAEMGPGLAFTAERDNQWAEDGRVTVALRVGDALEQGGLIFPVQSVITETVWYFTLPAGRVPVARV
jgi:hypothetical protein